MSNTKKGIYLSLLAAFISGVSIFLNKFAVESVGSPLLFTSVKNLVVAILIISIVLISGEWKNILKLSKKELSYLILVGLIGGAIPFYLYFTGLMQTPSINAAIIHKTLVIWVAIFALPFLKEKLTHCQVIAIALLFCGNIFVGGFKGFSFSGGELMILAATVLWAVETVIAKKVLYTVSPKIVASFRMGLGSFILIILSLISIPGFMHRSVSMSTQQYLWLGITAVLLIMYVTTWYNALKNASAVLVTAILVGSTLINNILSALFVTHTFNHSVLVQSLIIGLSVLTISILSRKNIVDAIN